MGELDSKKEAETMFGLDRIKMPRKADEVHTRISRQMEVEQPRYGKAKVEVVDGFEDLIGGPLGEGFYFNSPGTGYQLSFALAIAPPSGCMAKAFLIHMRIFAVQTRVYTERENLVAFVKLHIPRLKNSSILVVTSKIVALAEGAVVQATNARAKEAIIRAESEWQLQAKYGKLTLKDGLLMWNAGIDESNAKGNIILLPKDSFKVAEQLRRKLKQLYKVKLMGVVITDRRVMPLRAGVVGDALGHAGFRGLRDYRGEKDIFGRKLKYTQTDTADSLATAAVLMMGEGKEQKPLCVIEGAPVEFCEKVNRKELVVAPKDDMYRPLFAKIPKTAARKKKR